jgi:hypothetical protein
MTFTTLTAQDHMRSVVTAWRNAVDDRFSLIEAARVAGHVTERRRNAVDDRFSLIEAARVAGHVTERRRR